MRYKKHIKETLVLAVPVALSQLAHISVGVADTLMAGQINKEALAAATVALSMFFPIFMLYIGFSYGFTPLISQAHGEKNNEKIVRIFKHALLLNIIVGIFLTALLYSCMYLIPHLRQPVDIVRDATKFFSIIALSILPIIIFQIFKQFIEGMGHTKQAMIVSIGGNLLNIVLNVVLLYGYWGLPELGLFGIAYATLISRFFMAVAITIYFMLAKEYVDYRKMYRSIRFDSKTLIQVFKKSYPVGLQMSFESSAFSLSAILVGMFGTIQIAAHQIALNLASVTYMIATGIAAAATVRVGFEFGRKEKSDLQKAGITALILVSSFMIATAIMFTLLRTVLPSYYTHDAEVIQITATLLWMVVFFQLSDGIQVVSMGALRGMGDVLIPSSVAFTAYWIIGLPFGSFLAYVLGWEVYGIWVGLTVGLVFASIVLLVRFLRKAKKLVFEEI
ncbi:MATE family efflux transporter [uncultured Cytophaga sp.]|uniref:MATE family efflux transporter n=1 Tax=uncultured Cytophaga sp. TaxID=160238 RepID=UPI002609AACD|nr:MATE family efflux transporter [uncultured Cytophaga sp.]